MKTYFTKKEQIVILIVVLIIASTLSYKYLSSKIIAKEKDTEEIVINIDEDKEENTPTESKHIEEIVENYEGNIIVHISGGVKNPGIVELECGKRLVDAVETLGGLTEDADLDRINLAKKLLDEDKIYIPKIGEELENDLLMLVENTTSSKDTNKDNKDNKDKIEINTCTKEDFNSLPGIGDVLSERIILYRDTNRFKTIDDIKKVSGIGDKKFDGLKDLIIVK